MEKEPAGNETVAIRKEPIALYKFLKLANLVMSGAEAKFVVSEGLVTVNGAVETQKGKKLFAGDFVEFQGERIQVVLSN